MFTNFKSIIKYVVLFHIGIMTTTLTAQEYTPTSPSVNSLTKFDSHPVNLATGTPNISIPLTNLPTLSKDMSVDFVLNYHPSSVAVYDTLSGNTGRGWSLYNSGVISDTHFNFMGFTGTISDKDFSGVIQPTTVISEKNNNRIHGTIERDLNNEIIVYNLFDDKGYKYVFDLADNYVKIERGGQPGINEFVLRSVKNSSFHLTKVYDTKNGLILTFNYDTFYKVEDYHEGNEKNTYRQLKEVIAHNVGKVVFEHTLGQMNNFDDFKYTSMILRDFNNNQIKKFRFIYNGRNLIELIQDNTDNSKSLKHQFFYKAVSPNMNNTIVDIDSWGYRNEFDEWCMYDLIDDTNIVYGRSAISKALSPRYVATGVLEKIIYPTGGAVLYEYEANTFSYTGSQLHFEMKPIPGTINPVQWEHDPDYFYHFNGNNIHNFTKNTLASYTFTPGGANSFNFSVLDFPKKLYFKFDIDEFVQEMDLVDSPDATPTTMSFYPDFYLGASNGLFEIFPYIENVNFGTPAVPNFKPVRRFYKNNLNACSGQSLTLNPGTYQISLSSTAPHNGYASVQEINLVSNPKKWQYANGIRIKRIGYFENSSVPQNYYSSANPPTNYTPVKEMSYEYNLFDKPNRSSGYLLVAGVIEYADWAKKAVNRQGISPVWYQNVRVSQLGEAGSTDYTFVFPKDFEGDSQEQPLSSAKYGQPKEIKVYNEAGALQKKIENLYNYEEEYLSDPTEGVDNKFSIGWTALMQSKETSYFTNSNPIEVTSNFTYVIDGKLLASRTKTSSQNNETLLTKYFYDTRNTTTNLNRSALEKTEVFLNEKLLNTTFINYSNTWPIVNYGDYFGTPNLSYQAKTTLVSKHDNPLVQKMKVNLIDSNSNPVEIEQENGMKVSYIWGYNSTQVVAKIENMAFASIPANLITPIIDASNANNSVNLLTALNALRNHSSMANAMVTTFTHKPLIGVETVTDPKGFKITFFYDKFNRLEKVTDHTGKLLSENEYHYRTQN